MVCEEKMRTRKGTAQCFVVENSSTAAEDEQGDSDTRLWHINSEITVGEGQSQRRPAPLFVAAVS
jgi:hypothetical protein